MHWIQTAAVAPAQLLNTETRTKKLCNTVCAYIENRLFGFCWASQSFRKQCYQHQNRTTGAALLHSIPQNDTSSTYWSCRALKSHVLALMGAVRQYQSHTAGTCQNPTLRRLYNLSTLPEMEQLKNHEYGKRCEQKRTFGNSRKNHECAEMLRTQENTSVELFTLAHEASRNTRKY